MSRAKDWSRNTIYTRYLLLFDRLRGCFHWKEKDQWNGKMWVLLYFICSLAFAAGFCRCHHEQEQEIIDTLPPCLSVSTTGQSVIYNEEPILLHSNNPEKKHDSRK
jgi:hypothetical protein